MYIVQCKETGKYLPPVRAYKSSTVQELSENPRVFTTRSAAIHAARWWAAGHAGYETTYSGELGLDSHTELVSIPVPGRKLSNLELVRVGIRKGKREPVPSGD